MWHWLKRKFSTESPMQVVTATDFAVRDGDKIVFCDSSGNAKQAAVVTSANKTTLTIRGLKWYERLWQFLTFPPKTNYRHRLGILRISQVYSTDVYRDEITVMPNTRLGRIVQRFYSFLSRHQEHIARYDADSLDIREAEYFPWWSLSWWWFLPFRFANRFFPRISGHESREWPSRI